MAHSFVCVGVLADAKQHAIAYYKRYGYFELTPLRGMLGDRPERTVMFLELGARPRWRTRLQVTRFSAPPNPCCSRRKPRSTLGVSQLNMLSGGRTSDLSRCGSDYKTYSGMGMSGVRVSLRNIQSAELVHGPLSRGVPLFERVRRSGTSSLSSHAHQMWSGFGNYDMVARPDGKPAMNPTFRPSSSYVRRVHGLCCRRLSLRRWSCPR
jgi:hypothetical protein